MYWVSGAGAGSSIVKAPIGGGAAMTLVKNQNIVGPILVDATGVYWGGSTPNPVMTVLLAGGIATGLGDFSGDAPTGFIAQDATNVYWTSTYGNAVFSMPKGGGTVAMIASSTVSPSGLAVQGGTVYWAASAGCCASASGIIASAPVAGGTATTLATGLYLPTVVTVDATSVYFLDQGPSPSPNSDEGSVNRIPLAGGTPTVLAASQRSPVSLAVDDSNVYWGTAALIVDQCGGLWRVPKGGGSITTLVRGQSAVDGLAVDGTSVYWTDFNGEAVRKLTPK
jgi:hypothetical protein